MADTKEKEPKQGAVDPGAAPQGEPAAQEAPRPKEKKGKKPAEGEKQKKAPAPPVEEGPPPEPAPPPRLRVVLVQARRRRGPGPRALLPPRSGSRPLSLPPGRRSSLLFFLAPRLLCRPPP